MAGDLPNGRKKELAERVKELNCFYEISSVINDRSLPFREALQKVVSTLPPAMQHPDVCCARMRFGDEVFVSPGFVETRWRLSGDLRVLGEKGGSLSVYYKVEMPPADEGPFLREERRLINAVAELLSNFIDERAMRSKFESVQKDMAFLGGGAAGAAMDVDRETLRRKPDWEIIIDLLVKTDPKTLLRLTRKMMYHLYRLKNDRVVAVTERMCSVDHESGLEWCGINIPNPRMDMDALREVHDEVFEAARESLKPEEISRLFHRWLRMDRARPLLLTCQKSGIPLAGIRSELDRFWDQSEGAPDIDPADEISIRTALIRRFFTSRLGYINVAKKYMEIGDFVHLLKKTVGPATGEGKLGGKISGIFLAEKVIRQEAQTDELLADVAFARSWYVTSDGLIDTITYNDLDDFFHFKYLDTAEIRQEYPYLEQLFKNSTFGPETLDGFRRILREVGERPIIVRSSSLLEDSFGAAFSGKYKSLFLVNAGTEEERLAALLDAVAEVYASTFGPDPIEYRRERGLLDFNEQMGLLIQEVVGTRVGPYYMPVLAGVGFSNNEFRWSPRIRRGDGILRLVTGLGTRAVDRVSDDYPLLISPNRPEIRVNAFVDETVLYSQHYMDVINLETRSLETVRTADVLREHWDSFPLASDIASLHRDGILRDSPALLMDDGSSDIVVTFSGMISKGRLVKQLGKVLGLLKDRLGTPVDVEFAHDGKNLYVLQCRPQSQGTVAERVPVPRNIPNDRKLFSASRYVTTARLEGLEYVVYVDPGAYEALGGREEMLRVARAVGAVNNALPRRRFLLMGPGRWGSRGDIKLGVPVLYKDINNTAMLIEVALKKGGYIPELSFGTHFFQDLVEGDIRYLPLYPDEPGNVFNRRFLEIAPNRLAEVAPRYEALKDVVRVIRVADMTDGGTLTVVMDGDANAALAYTVPPDHWVWRMKKAEEIASELDAKLYGVAAFYVIGSSKNASAGPASDLDLLIHFRGTDAQREALMSWLKEWDANLVRENNERTGLEMKTILDVHLVTDQDMADRTSWAVHIGAVDDPARKIPLGFTYD